MRRFVLGLLGWLCACGGASDMSFAGLQRQAAHAPPVDAGLCACNNYAGRGPLHIGHSLGAGVNGAFFSSAAAHIDGNLNAVGRLGVRTDAPLTLGGTLVAPHACRLRGRADVAGDAFLGGWVEAPELSLAGTAFTHPNTKVRHGTRLPHQVTDAVSASAPCACAPDTVVDVAALVRSQRGHTDNRAYDIPIDALQGVAEPSTLTLPSGRFLFEGIRAAAPLALHVDGDAALFFDGDVTAQSNLRVEVSPGAQLDVFVRGDVEVRGAFCLGGGATRLFTSGTRMRLEQTARIDGDIYAPQAWLRAIDDFCSRGSLFAANIYHEAWLDIASDACAVR